MFKKLQLKMMLLNISIVAVVVVTVIGIGYISSRSIMRRRAGELRGKIESMSKEEILGNRKYLLNSGILGGKVVMIVSDTDGQLVEQDNLYVKDGFYMKEREEVETLLARIRAESANNRYISIDEKVFYTFNLQRNDRIMYFMIDATQERELNKAILMNSIYIGSGAIILIIIAALFITRVSIKPVKNAWDRQRQFISDASHELRTPVSVIKTNMEIVGENDSATVGEHRRWIDNVISETEHMGQLVNDLLFISKMDNSRKSKFSDFSDLQKVVLNIVGKFNLLIKDKDLELSVDMSPAKVYVRESELHRLITLLLDNAIKFTDKGRITIRNSIENENCVLEVSDTGRGIDEEEQKDIFKRFYKVDSDRNRKTGGYGLGLSIAKSIVDGYNGKIEVSSEIGKGSTFRIILPKVKENKG